MPYANAYAYAIRIRCSKAVGWRGIVGCRDCGFPGRLAAALPHRRPRAVAGPGDVRVALPAAGCACHVRDRRDGVRGGTDLAGPARSLLVLHRRAGRVYVAAAVPVITNRIWTPVLFIALQPLHDSVFHGDDVRFLWVAGIGAWLGWTIPLLIVQRWLGSKVVIPR